MKLNTLSPAPGSKKKAKRVGRGIGSGLGKTGGRGHKGQKSRKGNGIKPGFEGGQQPLQRRLPKFGFASRKAMITAEIRLNELAKVDAEVVDIEALRAANLINSKIERVRVVLSGEIDKPVVIKGLHATKGAKAAIDAAGGKVED